MKLVVTADLHYNVARSVEPTRTLAEEICKLEADALLILGDVGGRDSRIVSDCLHLFDRFSGQKFFVAGNHDIWVNPGEDSLERFENALPALCREADFHPLDVEPALVNHVGIVGSMGWYDASFRPARLEIPYRFYEHKVAPGAASRLSRYKHLVEDLSDVPEAAMRVSSRWMDGEHVRLSMSDLEFCHYLRDRLSQHLETVADQCHTIVVGLHHIPFAQLIPHNDDPNWAFAGAFLGSELFGQAMLDHPKIRYALCAHSHLVHQTKIQHIECINVGCTYVKKRYEIIEL